MFGRGSLRSHIITIIINFALTFGEKLSSEKRRGFEISRATIVNDVVQKKKKLGID